MTIQIPPRLREGLKDRRWRLENLYYIKDKYGRKIKFKLNWAQKELLDGLHPLVIIPKARQLGITTFFCILFLDHCLFNRNINAAIIADRYVSAKSIFQDKVKFAYDNLHPLIKIIVPAFRDSANEMRFGSGSIFKVSTSLRSGTNQLLHISEFGKICRQFPHKANEIITGALNTVAAGQFIAIESTAEGRAGHFAEMVRVAQAKQIKGEKLGQMDYKLFFFPWYREIAYRLDKEQ